jgi:hypothetical protein
MPRKPTVDDDKLKTLEQRLAKAKRDLARAITAQKDEERRIDTRRKVIAGALALEHLEKNAGLSSVRSCSGCSMNMSCPVIAFCSSSSPRVRLPQIPRTVWPA